MEKRIAREAREGERERQRGGGRELIREAVNSNNRMSIETIARHSGARRRAAGT